MSHKTCPTIEKYQDMLEGKLPAEQVESLASHVEGCPSCAGTIAGLESDTLSEALRAGAKSAQRQDEPALQKLVERSKASIARPRDGTVSISSGASAAQVPGIADPSETLALLGKPESAGEIGRLGGYRVLRELGHGGMGAVFEAEDVKLERRIALKVMKPEIAKNQQHRERFLREARTAARVESDYICPIYQVGEENGIPFIAMPFLKGEPLDAPLRKGIQLPIDQIVRIGKEVAEGLSAAHEAGLIHRDIKPANIWLETQRAGPPRARILDFGLARAHDDVQITQSGAILGTPAYMSPEQARGQKDVDGRADLFSLGCVLYALCSGEMPFKGDTTMGILMALAIQDPVPPHKISSAVPEPLSDLIMHLLAKDPDKRPATARDVIDELVKLERTLPKTPIDAVTAAPKITRSSDTTVLRKANTKTQTQIMPAGAPPRKTSFVLFAMLALGLFGSVLTLAGGGVYYIVTDKGTIEIKTMDDSIKVLLEDNGGKVTILDPKAKQSWVINTGAYTVRLGENADGLDIVLPDNFVMKRGGKQVVTVQRVKKTQDADKIPPKTLPAPTAEDLALSLDSYASLVCHPDLKLDESEPFTIEAYVTPRSNTNGSVFAVPSQCELGITENKWAFRIRQAGKDTRVFFGPIAVGQRTHVVCIRDHDEIRLFLDGKKVVVEPIEKNSLISVSSGPFMIGVADANSPARTVGCLMDEVRISKVARYHKGFTPQTRFDPDADTLALYHCDEGTGDVLKDSSGNNHHGKIVGAKWVKADGMPIPSVDHALQFDGKTSHVLLPSLVLADSPLTIEARVFCARGPTSQLVRVHGEVFGSLFADTGLGFMAGPERPGMRARFDLPHGEAQWRYVAGVWDGKETRLYVDGQPAQDMEPYEKIAAWGASIGAFPVSVKGPAMTAFLTGKLDEIRISNVARYSKPYVPQKRLETDAHTLALYHCDEGSGDVLKDSSGNNHHGKIVGAKWVKADGTPMTPTPPRVGYVLRTQSPAKLSDNAHGVTVPTLKLPGKGPYTVETYFTPAANNFGRLLWIAYQLNLDLDKDYTLRIAAKGRTADGKMDHTAHVPASILLVPGKAHHLAVVRTKDESQFELYIDGKRVGTGPAIVGGADPFVFGRIGGDFAEFRVSKVARYTGDFLPARRFEPDADTLALYHMDEDSGDKLIDSSGNNHHGKIVGAKWVKTDEPQPSGAGPRFKNILGMEFALVPKGKAWLGGGGGKPGDKVFEFKNDFFLGVHEVTQEEWETVMGNNPSPFSRGGSSKNEVKDILDADLKRFPVSRVSWQECQEFLLKLNDKTKEEGWIYRLPTEDEWEYACRGGPGSKKDYYDYNYYLDGPTNSLLPNQANWMAAKPKLPTKVGSYAPNRLGLFDMHANVAEWCEDALVDGKGAPQKVTRGGEWAGNCQAAFRQLHAPGVKSHAIGLRVARISTVKAKVVNVIAPEHSPIDLLPMVDLATDRLAGAWKTDPDGSVRTAVEPRGHYHLRLPVSVKGDYRLKFEFTHLDDGMEMVTMIFPVGSAQAEAGIGSNNNNRSGFGSIDGVPFNDNATNRRKMFFVKGKRNRVIIEVHADAENAKVTAIWNGDKFVDWSGPIAKLSMPADRALSDRSSAGLWLADRCTNTHIHQVTLEMISGEATLLRPADAGKLK